MLRIHGWRLHRIQEAQNPFHAFVVTDKIQDVLFFQCFVMSENSGFVIRSYIRNITKLIRYITIVLPII